MTRKQKIVEVASLLHVPAAWLDGLIAFETGGSYDPLEKNPTSSARGLIQIIDSTAQAMFGMSSEALVNKYNTFDSQMDNVVLPYLTRYMPYSTKQSLYMAVFYPVYRHEPPDTVFPKRVRDANPGIRTVADYVNYVDRRVAASRLIKTGAPIAGIALAALGWYYYRRVT